jgi:hypothetical protein
MDHHLEEPVSTYSIKVSQKHCKNRRSRIRKTNNNRRAIKQKSHKDVEGRLRSAVP